MKPQLIPMIRIILPKAFSKIFFLGCNGKRLTIAMVNVSNPIPKNRNVNR